ncbi:MAG: diacylglycerol kinase family protein [Micavibrio sp.]|nr:diacylglycerol kinase family protein [Micavibrio sp.]
MTDAQTGGVLPYAIENKNEILNSAEKIDAEKIDVVINRRAGTVLRLGEEAVRMGLEESLGARLGSMQFIDGAEIAPTVKAWVAANSGNGEKGGATGRGLVLGGGDGSILTAAGEFLGRDDITLGVLPLGTHNLFARQLGFAADFRAAARQYKNVASAKVDVGNVNGENFLVGLMIDRNSVDFFNAREDVRSRKPFSALRRIFTLAANVIFGRKARLDVSGTPQKGRMFVITNNRLQPRPSTDKLPLPQNLKPIIENAFAKGRPDDGTLAFYAFDGGAHNIAGLLRKIWDGRWTAAKNIRVQTAPELVIQPAAVTKRTALPVILDGEMKIASYPLNVKLLPQALKVYRPS